MSRNSAAQSPFPRSRDHSEKEQRNRKSTSKESLPEFGLQKSSASKAGSNYSKLNREDKVDDNRKSSSKVGYNLLNLSKKENIAE